MSDHHELSLVEVPSPYDQLLHPSETPATYIDGLAAMQKAAEHAVMPTTAQLTAANSLGKTTLRFVFWEHFQQNQKFVIPLLHGCDVLAIECAYTPEARAGTATAALSDEELDQSFHDYFNAHINPGSISSATVTRLEETLGLKRADFVQLSKQQRQAQLAKYNPSGKIMASVVDQVHELALLDIRAEHSKDFVKLHGTTELNLTQEIVTIHRKLLSSSTWDELVSKGRDELTRVADMMFYRENIAAQQIRRLICKYPGETIGILYGSDHHKLTRHFGQDDVVIQRIFAHREKETLALARELNLAEEMVAINDNRAWRTVERVTALEILFLFADRNIANGLTFEEIDSFTEKVRVYWENGISELIHGGKKDHQQIRATLHGFILSIMASS